MADTLGVWVDNVYDNLSNQGGWTLLLATLLFTIQIYGDFAGYSNIAIGSARLFGIELSENFQSPYTARSVKEFWRRWHISLSRWFSEYVYIPLGGSRCSRPRHLANLLLTFLVQRAVARRQLDLCALGALPRAVALPGKPSRCRKPKRCKQSSPRATRWPAGCLRPGAPGLTFCIVSAGWAVFRANSPAEPSGYLVANWARAGSTRCGWGAYAAAAGMDGRGARGGCPA